MKSDFLNPRFLRYFVRVADLGSIISASKDLNVSQPSITRAIQILETNFGKDCLKEPKRGSILQKKDKYFT